MAFTENNHQLKGRSPSCLCLGGPVQCDMYRLTDVCAKFTQWYGGYIVEIFALGLLMYVLAMFERKSAENV